MEIPSNDPVMNIKIPFSTILKVMIVIIIMCVLKTLALLLITLFLAVLMAVSLRPFMRWLEKKGAPRWLAILFIAIVLVTIVFTFSFVVLPVLLQQFYDFLRELPDLKNFLLDYLSPHNPLRPFIEKNMNKEVLFKTTADYTQILSAGNVVLHGFGEIILVFVFTVYLLIDGPGVLEWITAFFSESVQDKLKKTADEVSVVISSYVVGQLVTSILSFIYVFATLWFLHIPSVLLLAVLAGVFDILPVLGFFLAVIPAMLFAVTVSVKTAVIVLFLYIFYHALENYFIIPFVYGNRLRVSTFVILISLIVGGLLGGIEGAIAILPIVASYPIVERIWLKRMVGQQTLTEHAKIGKENV